MRIVKRNSANGALSKLNMEYLNPINNVFNSLWASVNTKLNGCEISDPSSKWYAYKAYFENHLSYSSSSKNNILSFERYVADTATKFDDVGNSTSTTQSINDGFLKRKQMFATSKWVYFCVNLHIDITTLRKYIPPGIKIELDFEKSRQFLSVIR